jgi:tetratricopeptide (TPR) repeat protein
MDYKGGIYMMTKGPQALKLLKKALSLDEKNYTAMNSLGMYYINAPAIGGGSVDKGIEVLQKALESKDEFDNFISNVWLGTAFQKKKNTDEASRHYQSALKIFPNCPWVKRLLQTS